MRVQAAAACATEPQAVRVGGRAPHVAWFDGRRAPRVAPVDAALRRAWVVRTLYTANLVGVVFSRTLHYQSTRLPMRPQRNAPRVAALPRSA